MTGAAASVVDDIYSQVRGRTNTNSNSNNNYGSNSGSGSGSQPRSKARIDSEVQIMESAVTNLKVSKDDINSNIYYFW